MLVCYQLLTNRTMAPLMVHAARDLVSACSNPSLGEKPTATQGLLTLGLIKQGTIKASRPGAYTTFWVIFSLPLVLLLEQAQFLPTDYGYICPTVLLSAPYWRIALVLELRRFSRWVQRHTSRDWPMVPERPDIANDNSARKQGALGVFLFHTPVAMG